MSQSHELGGTKDLLSARGSCPNIDQLSGFPVAKREMLVKNEIFYVNKWINLIRVASWWSG